jgi:uncharacterized protein YrzB (UPF0473 family)
MDNNKKEMVDVIDVDGLYSQVELVTYLNSVDNKRQYMVYTKNEVQGNDGDVIIYISKLTNVDGVLHLSEIEDDTEWVDVQHLLKEIANNN